MSGRPRPPMAWVAAGALAALVVLLGASAAPRANPGGDSALLVWGTRAALECLDEATVFRCGHPGPPGGPVTEVEAYPLLQYLPAGAMVLAGLGDDAILNGLLALSTAAYAAAVALVALAGRRLPGPLGPLLVAIVALSPLLFYAVSPFGEMLAAAMVLAAVLAALARRPGLAAVAVAVACIGKETLFPFVVVLALVAGRGPADRWLPPRRLTTAILAGAAAGVAANVAFNLFRFGTPRNLVYLDPALRVDRLGDAGSFLGALWAAPAGGLVWFWPAAAAGLVALGAAAVSVRRRGGPELVAPLAAAGTVVATTVGLARWFSPMGWVAWGPRLLLPVLPGALVAGAWAARRPLAAWAAAALARPVRRAAVAAALAAGAWPHLGVPWTEGRAFAVMVAPSAGCPDVRELDPYSRPDQYYGCTRRALWRLEPSALATASTGGGWPAWAGRGAGVVAAGALVLAAHAATSGPPAPGRRPRRRGRPGR